MVTHTLSLTQTRRASMDNSSEQASEQMSERLRLRRTDKPRNQRTINERNRRTGFRCISFFFLMAPKWDTQTPLDPRVFFVYVRVCVWIMLIFAFRLRSKFRQLTPAALPASQLIARSTRGELAQQAESRKSQEEGRDGWQVGREASWGSQPQDTATAARILGHNSI